MATRYAVKVDGETVVEHQTREQCIIEAYERGLVLKSLQYRALADGVTIESIEDSET